MFRHTVPNGCWVLQLWHARCFECPHFNIQNELPANNCYWFQAVLFPNCLGIKHCIYKFFSYATGSLNVMTICMVLLLLVTMVTSLPPTQQGTSTKLVMNSRHIVKQLTMHCLVDLRCSFSARLILCSPATWGIFQSLCCCWSRIGQRCLWLCVACDLTGSMVNICYQRQWNHLHSVSTGEETQQHYMHFIWSRDIINRPHY